MYSFLFFFLCLLVLTPHCKKKRWRKEEKNSDSNHNVLLPFIRLTDYVLCSTIIYWADQIDCIGLHWIALDWTAFDCIAFHWTVSVGCKQWLVWRIWLMSLWLD